MRTIEICLHFPAPDDAVRFEATFKEFLRTVPGTAGREPGVEYREADEAVWLLGTLSLGTDDDRSVRRVQQSVRTWTAQHEDVIAVTMLPEL